MKSNKVSKSLTQILSQLHGERERLEDAIARLEETLQPSDTNQTAKRGRGRPAATQVKMRSKRTPVKVRTRSRAGWTAGARQAAAERMQQYWADQAAGKTKKRRSKKSASQGQEKKPRAARRSTEGWTDNARQAAAERMRTYWANRRNQKVTG